MTNETTTINHIRGDTFILNVNITGATGITSVRSQVRTKDDQLIGEAVVTGADTAWTLTIMDTTDWPVGKLYMDIQITMGTVIKSSETTIINVVKDVTQ